MCLDLGAPCSYLFHSRIPEQAAPRRKPSLAQAPHPPPLLATVLFVAALPPVGNLLCCSCHMEASPKVTELFRGNPSLSRAWSNTACTSSKKRTLQVNKNPSAGLHRLGLNTGFSSCGYEVRLRQESLLQTARQALVEGKATCSRSHA